MLRKKRGPQSPDDVRPQSRVTQRYWKSAAIRYRAPRVSAVESELLTGTPAVIVPASIDAVRAYGLPFAHRTQTDGMTHAGVSHRGAAAGSQLFHGPMAFARQSLDLLRFPRFTFLFFSGVPTVPAFF